MTNVVTGISLNQVGRAPKVYEPTEADIHVAIPQRQHGLLAEVLLDAGSNGYRGRAVFA
jgi:hypothetical protein